MSSDRNVQQTQLEMLPEDSNHYNVAPSSKRKGKIWRNKILIGVLVVIVLAVLCYVILRFVRKPFYAIVIDAGSSGSRVHAFKFSKSLVSSTVILDDELYEFIRPGLSSYADDPVKGAGSLAPLLDKAKAFIPESKWGDTPLSLKATAGLRLLSDQQANSLLDECKKLFEKSGFQTTKDSASIMDGKDEGIFSWMTVNFLLNRLTGGSSDDTVAALDLGGASTQVTYVPHEKHLKNQKEHIYHVNALNNNITVYAQSYLGMGLDAARNAILTSGQNVTKNENGAPIELHSQCINPIVSSKWSYKGVNYLVKGPLRETKNPGEGRENRTVVKFDECIRTVQNYINTIESKPLGLEEHEIVAFSYYFEGAQQVGLVDPVAGGFVTVDDYLTKAKELCDTSNINRPFICLDMIYIYVLLHDGLNLKPSTKLELHGKIDEHKLSWALGAAFDISQNQL